VRSGRSGEVCSADTAGILVLRSSVVPMRLVPIGAVLAHHTTLHLRLFRSVSMSTRVPAINERRPSPWLLWVRAGSRFKSRRGTSPSMPSPMAKPSRELSSSDVCSTAGIVACLNGKTTNPSQRTSRCKTWRRHDFATRAFLLLRRYGRTSAAPWIKRYWCRHLVRSSGELPPQRAHSRFPLGRDEPE
jgi:hypothetical protein